MEPFWVAWLELHSSRPQGMNGPAGIPPSEIAVWLDLNGVHEPECRLEYFELITAADSAYLEWAAKQAERQRSKT